MFKPEYTGYLGYGKSKKTAPEFVGWLIVTEKAVKRVTGQTACNYEDIEILPGAYPVFVSHLGRAKVAYIPGTIVQDFYQNRLFHETSNHHNENVGVETTYTEFWYDYQDKDIVGFIPFEKTS